MSGSKAIASPRPSPVQEKHLRRTALIVTTAHVRQYWVFYFALLGAFFTIAAYYPGFMSPDSGEQLRQARYGVTSNVFPPLMAYIWRVTDRVIPGPGGMLILQNLVFWLSLAAIAWYATMRAVLRALFVFIGGLSPPVLCNLGTVWKDTVMLVALVAAVAAILAAHRHRQLRWFVLALIAIFLAAGFRHNALTATIPLMAFMLAEAIRIVPSAFPRIYSWLKGRDLLRAAYSLAAACVLLTIMGALHLTYYYKVIDGRLYTGAMVYDLAGISVDQNIDYLPDYAKRRDHVTLADLKRMYSPLHANSVYVPEARLILQVPNPLMNKTLDYQITEAEAADLRMRWLVAVLDNPGSYLHNKLIVARTLLVLTPYQPWYPYADGIDPNALGLVYHRTGLNARVMEVVHYSAFATHMFSAWIYYAIVLACVVVSFLWNFEYAWLVRALGCSVILYFLSIFFFGMSGDFRYNIWALTGSHICLLLLLCGRRRRTVNENR
jgi:hypothetical protein